MRSEKLRSIELLRGFAALWVVLFHIHTVYNPLRYNWQGPVAEFLSLGHSGVDLFFVISGFVIGWVTFFKPNPMRSPLEFAIRRFFRVAPLYWIATAMFMFWYPNGVTFENLVRSLAFVPGTGAMPPFYSYPVLYVGWSLNYEIYFYGLVLTVLVCRLGWKSLLVVMAAILMGAPFMLRHTISAEPEVGYQFPHVLAMLATNPIVWEFVLGLAVALLFSITTHLRLSRAAWAVFGVAALFSFWYLETATFEHFSLLYRGLPSALLVYAMLELERRGVFRFGAVSEWAGGWSYALYLSHPFILLYAQHNWYLPPKTPFMTINAYIVLSAVSIAVAAAIHKKTS